MNATTDSAYTEPLNFRVSPRMKNRLGDQSKRLDITLTATARLAMSLGLEALEKLHAEGDVSITD